MKVLNLYAGIGGNRKLWTDVEVTAVENNESIAAIYQDFFPDDKMIITDAHQYLLEHFKEFDFIWSSPPCPTHSRLKIMGVKAKRSQHKPSFPSMVLYEEILFLKHFSNCPYLVENVISYYEPLVIPQKLNRHYFWANFKITNIPTKYGGNIKKGYAKELQIVKGVNIDKYKIIGRRKDSTIRSYFDSKLGLHILECARGNYNYLKQKQVGMFNDQTL